MYLIIIFILKKYKDKNYKLNIRNSLNYENISIVYIMYVNMWANDITTKKNISKKKEVTRKLYKIKIIF